MKLNELLPIIDQYQYIKIQYRGDILYQGQRRYFIASDIHSNIYVVNILVIESDDIQNIDTFPHITICIDRDFN